MFNVTLVRGLVVALSMLSLAPGCGDDLGGTPDAPVVDAPLVDAMPSETIMVSRSLVPAELAEGILTGGPSDFARITLMAPNQELDWNIHGHANGATQVVSEGFNQMSVDYLFTPPAQAKWYLLVRNSGPIDISVDVKIELFGAMTWEWL